MHEQIPQTFEFTPSEIALITELKENDIDEDHPEIVEHLIAWMDEQEARALKVGKERAQGDLELRRAKLYRAAGLTDIALESLDDVRRIALQEEEADLYDEVTALMESLEEEIAFNNAHPEAN